MPRVASRRRRLGVCFCLRLGLTMRKPLSSNVATEPLEQRLHPEDVEAIAQRVAELVHPADDYLTVAEFCRRFDISRSTAYEHATDIGAIRIGGALRFPASVAQHVPSEAASAAEPRPTLVRSRRPSGPIELLPVRDRRAS